MCARVLAKYVVGDITVHVASSFEQQQLLESADWHVEYYINGMPGLLAIHVEQFTGGNISSRIPPGQMKGRVALGWSDCCGHLEAPRAVRRVEGYECMRKETMDSATYRK